LNQRSPKLLACTNPQAPCARPMSNQKDTVKVHTVLHRALQKNQTNKC
jgi:hypothetical protein